MTQRDDAPVLPATARRLLHRLAATQVSAHAPSIVAGVVRDGALVWSGGWGDVPGRVDDTQYRIGSLTKTFTAVAVLQAVRDDLFGLQTPIAALVDELADSAYAQRTVRQLLSHTAGLPSEPAGAWWERSEGIDVASLIAANSGTTEVFPPGQQHHYTNLAYALLGEALARARRRPWWDVVRTGILEPLGMRRTTYAAQEPHAHGFSVHPYTSELTAEPSTDTGAMAPAGQAWSTIADLGRYAAFLAEGHPDVVSGEWLDLASHPVGATRHDRLRAAHGLGFQLLAGGSGMLRGHLGSMPGFQSACLVDPPRRTGAVVLANSTSGTPGAGLAVDLLEVVHEEEPTLPPPWRPTSALPALVRDVVGTWHWGNTPVVFTAEGDQVVARVRGVESYRFVVRPRTDDGSPPGRDDLELVGISGYHDGEPVRVHRRPGGSVSHLEIATFVYTRTPYDPGAPIPGGHPV